jgi:ankyrin repeat protein
LYSKKFVVFYLLIICDIILVNLRILGHYFMLSAISSNKMNNSTSLGLQAAIEGNDQDQVVSVLKKQVDLAGSPLPNGEMPLHYAIRRGDSSLVKKILEEIKFDPHFKDGQGLTAADHAQLRKDPKIIAAVLGHQIGRSFKIVQKKPLTESQLDLIQKICSTKYPIDPAMSCLQRAALSGDLAAIEKGIKEGSPLDVQTSDKKTLLHLAAIGGNSEVIQMLLSTKKFDGNSVDDRGLRALHYAMTHESLTGSQALIAAGSHPVKKEELVSPLNIMLYSATIRSAERDPLKLTDLQLTLFATILASWAALYCVGTPLADAASVMTNAVTFMMTCTSLKSVKSALAFGGLFVAGSIPGFNIVYQGWKTYVVGQEAVKGIGTCWRNLLLETYRPLRNAIVHLVNGTHVFDRLMKVTEDTAQQVIDANQKKMDEANEEFERSWKAGEETLRKQREEFELKRREVIDCFEIDPKFCEGKEKLDCLLEKDLRPHCENHAEFILGLSKGYTFRALKTAFRTISKEIHPDKHRTNKENATIAQAKLSEAFGVLKAAKKPTTSLPEPVILKALPSPVDSQSTVCYSKEYEIHNSSSSR